MTTVRPQFHFRRTASGIDAWLVQGLIELSRDLPVIPVSLAAINELDQNHWYFQDDSVPTPRSLLDHMRLIDECDLRYPIILDAQGRVMDGMHRVCKALLLGRDHIDAVQFEVDPPPDYVDCDPGVLSRQLGRR